MPKKKSSYFTHKIPQSEYRNVKEKTSEDRVKLDTNLDPLNIKDKEIKKGLKEKIEKELMPLFTNLFPDDHHIKILEGPLLKKIYKKLDL